MPARMWGSKCSVLFNKPSLLIGHAKAPRVCGGAVVMHSISMLWRSAHPSAVERRLKSEAFSSRARIIATDEMADWLDAAPAGTKVRMKRGLITSLLDGQIRIL